MNARPEVRGAHIGSRSHFQGALARLTELNTLFGQKTIDVLILSKQFICKGV
jgi:hypothetical protein